jgi:hypothetical protein
MSFTISTPYPHNQTTIVLPNPLIGDSEAHTSEVIVKRTMSGRAQTFVRRKNQRKKLTWSFRVTRNKALEVREFFRSYHGSKMRIIDHEDRSWTGFVVTNPIDIDIPKRGHPGGEGYQTISGSGETCEFTVEFQAWEFDTGARPSQKIAIDITSSPNNCEDENRIPITQQVSCNLVYDRQATLDSIIKHRWDASELSLDNDEKVLEVPDLGYGHRRLVPYAPWWDRPDGYPDYAPHFYEKAFGDLPGIYFGTVIIGPDPRISGAYSRASTTSSLQTWHTDIRLWNGGAKKGTVFLIYRNAIGFVPGSAKAYRWFQMRGSRVNFALHNRYIPIASATAKPEYIAYLSTRRNDTPSECFCLEPGGSSIRPASYWVRYVGQTSIHPALGYSNLSRNLPEELYDGSLDGLSLTVRGRPYLYTFIREEGTNRLRFRMNGIENKGATLPNVVTPPGRLYFASGNSIGTAGRGFMGEMRVYRESLSDTDLNYVERELMLKWGIPNVQWQHEEECFSDYCVVQPTFCSEPRIPFTSHYNNPSVIPSFPDYICSTDSGEDCP